MPGSDDPKTLVRGPVTQVDASTIGSAADHRALPSTPDHYELGEVLGRGGMGEVVLARDPRIGRDVAIKRMLIADPEGDLAARFLREARIQARLDHPAIVPVHELGYDASGRPFFVMKRLAGTTLLEVLGARQTTNRLLRALAEVCLAIELAHARGVVHRDLKPANIMLGDYGEVYILDWGVARELDAAGEVHQTVEPVSSPGTTQLGTLLGTPGYAAPEQVRGEPVGIAADIYSLGAIMFEILAGESLHPRDTAAAVASTLVAPTIAPSARALRRTIAPELDAACLAALAADPKLRPTARALADRIQLYLDGDRDVEQRRRLATEHVARAREILAGGDPEQRATAVYEAGQAVALDPESQPARTLLMTLLVEPPREFPAPLVADLQMVEDELATREARGAMFTLATYFLFLPLMIWVGIADIGQVAAVFSLVALWIGYTLIVTRTKRRFILPILAFNITTMVLMSRLVGPFVVVPGLVVAFSVVSVQQAMLGRPYLVAGAGIVALLIPIVLELAGVFERTWHTTNGAFSIQPSALRLGSTEGAIFLVACNIAVVVVTTLLSDKVAAQRRHAQQRLAIQAWHLRNMLPADAPQPTFVSGPVARV